MSGLLMRYAGWINQTQPNRSVGCTKHPTPVISPNMSTFPSPSSQKVGGGSPKAREPGPKIRGSLLRHSKEAREPGMAHKPAVVDTMTASQGSVQ